MARSQRTKLALKDLGDPAMVKTIPEKDRGKGYFMGTIVGIATGIVERKNEKTGEIMEGLAGTFRHIPADKARDELESGILWIPDAFHNMVAQALKKSQAADPNSELKFAFEVKSIAAQNPAGYSWEFLPVGQPNDKNPLDEFLENIGTVKEIEGKGRVLSLTDQTKDRAAAKK